MEDSAADGDRIHNLSDLISLQTANGLPPVEKWNPPHCGDIGMAIASNGEWLYRGSPIQRKPLVKLFSRILRRDPDGAYYLVTPAEKIIVDVADAPFLAVEMQVEGQGDRQQLIFRTNVDDIVHCGPAHPLRFSEHPENGGLKPYIRVRGNLDALLTRAVSYDLITLAVSLYEDGADQDNDDLAINSGGANFKLI